MSLDLVESRPERGVGAISDSRGETLRAIAGAIKRNGLFAAIRAADSDDEVLSIVDNAPGLDVDDYYRDLEAPGSTDEYGAAPELTVEQRKPNGERRTNAEEKAILADAVRAIANRNYDPDSTAGSELSGQEARRALRTAAEEQITADPELDASEWIIDARAGELGQGRTQIILQDPETNRTRTIALDESATQNPEQAVDGVAERADAIDWESGRGEAPEPSDSGNGLGQLGGIMLVAAVATAVYYGVTQL